MNMNNSFVKYNGVETDARGLKNVKLTRKIEIKLISHSSVLLRFQHHCILKMSYSYQYCLLVISMYVVFISHRLEV